MAGIPCNYCVWGVLLMAVIYELGGEDYAVRDIVL